MPCSQGMQKCKAKCAHRTFVTEYQRERQRQEDHLDDIAHGYPTERADLIERGYPPPVTFKQWLTRR